MFPANLFRSTHYLNLQPQQPLQLLSRSPSSFSLLPNALPSHSFILFSHYCALSLSPTLALSVSLSPFLPHLNFLGLMFLQECSLPPPHTTGLKEGVWSWWEGSRFLAWFWEERRILGLCLSLSLSLSRLASLCDLWSLTSCLHMGGHGCGVEGVLKWEEWGRV